MAQGSVWRKTHNADAAQYVKKKIKKNADAFIESDFVEVLLYPVQKNI